MIVRNGEYNPEKVAAAMDDLGMKDKAQAERETFGLVEGHTINAATPIPPDPDGKRRLVKSEKTSEKDRLSWELLSCEMMVHNYSVRFNTISNDIEVQAKSITGREMDLDDTITALHSELGGKYKGCTLENITAYIAFIAKENAYNPVLELLESIEWDGTNRIDDVFSLLGIESDVLSCVLVRKWLFQTIALLYNELKDPYGAEGVLVLNGAQGVGKTSFFRHLAIRPAWFLEGATIKDNDKDTTRRIVTRWISELGEVESTLKSDISALKAFVTSDVDVYRLPYARGDRKVARKTSLCATCNSDRYLIDPTGNRRWWSVPIEKRMEYTEIQQLDALQLWAQIYAIVKELSPKERAACFRLTAEEQSLLAIRNGEFEKPVKAEEECRDIIEAAKAAGDRAIWKTMTVSEWKTEHINVLRPYSANQIGAALKKLGYETHPKWRNGKQDRLCELPTATLFDDSVLLKRIK